MMLLVWTLLALSITQVLAADISKRGSGFDDINPDDTDQACDGGACASCPPGWQPKEGNCAICPYNTYSEDGKACVKCPNNKKTVYKGTAKPDECGDVCIIPQHENRTFMEDENKAHLIHDDRVMVGTKIVIVCHKGYSLKVEGTEDETVNYMFVTCTNDLFFPPDCSVHKQKWHALCYNNCYKEIKDGKAVLKGLSNGRVSELKNCPIASCPNTDDVCVTVSTTTSKASLHKFMCSDSSLSDEALCLEAGEGECEVRKCSEDKCNNPALSSASRSSYMTAVAMLTAVLFLR